MDANRRLEIVTEFSDLLVELAQDLRRAGLASKTARARAELAAARLAIAQELRHMVRLEGRLIREAARLERARRSARSRSAAALALPPDATMH